MFKKKLQKKTKETFYNLKQMDYKSYQDHFFKRAKIEGYRSRSAFKLIELDNKFKFLKNGIKLLDLGSYPGGWCQVVLKKIKKVKILGIDKKKVEKICGAEFIMGDFLDKKSQKLIIEYFGSSIDFDPNSLGDLPKGFKRLSIRQTR